MRPIHMLLLSVVLLVSACAAMPPAKPSPATQPIVQQPATPQRQARLPDPPAPVPTSGPTSGPTQGTPPPASPSTNPSTSPSATPPSTPSPAATPEPVPQGPVALAFHMQISEQESIPAARGLVDRLVLPSGLPILHNTVDIVYEWRPEDGKEKRLNPRTQKPYGPIWRTTLAEQMEPENLTRHLNTMGPWLDAFVPKDFAGIVCLDVEQWSLKGDEFHMSKPFKDDLARRAPGKKQSDLMAEFMRVTEQRARELRPRVKGWGWWAMGGMHPSWPVWRKDQYDAWKRNDLESDARALRNIQVPMPAFYFPTGFKTDAERLAAWETMKENWVLMYGKERLARDGYAYLNVTHDSGPTKDQSLTRAELHECIEQAKSLGMRRFVLWDFIDGPPRYQRVQKFLDEVFVPEVRAQAAAEAASRQPPSQAPAPATPGPSRRD